MGRLLPSDLTPLQLSLGETAELRTLDLLRRRLPAEYTVYHSVHWSLTTTERAMFGEADFVVVNRSGETVVVEQKAGGIEETRQGLAKTYAGGATKFVAPQLQRTLEALRKQFARQTGDGTLSIDYLFYCPDHTVKDPLSAGISADRIVDATEADRLANRIVALIGPGQDCTQGRSVHRFFESEFQLVPDIHAHVREGDRAMRRAAGGLADVLSSIEMQPLRLRVRGTAGCGKSVVALRFAEAAQAQGKRCLLVCFNRPLAERLRAMAPAGVRVTTFHGLLDSFLQSLGHRLDFAELERPGFWIEVQEKVIAETVSDAWSFEALIVDEGQDFEADWFDILRLFLRPGADILWLEDPDQAIRHLADDRRLTDERFEAEGFIGYRAKANYRSPRSIATYIAEQLPTFHFVAANPLPGLGVGERESTGPDNQAKLVGALIGDLRRAGFALGDIAVLSMRGLTSASLRDVERVGSFSLCRPTGQYDLLGNQLHSAGQIRFDTIYRFKGQEAPAIILTDVPFTDELSSSRLAADRLFFTATTRATVKLEIVFSRRPS